MRCNISIVFVCLGSCNRLVRVFTEVRVHLGGVRDIFWDQTAQSHTFIGTQYAFYLCSILPLYICPFILKFVTVVHYYLIEVEGRKKCSYVVEPERSNPEKGIRWEKDRHEKENF